LSEKMPTLSSIQSLVKTLASLSLNLPTSVKPGVKTDKIWTVMNAEERHDLLFRESGPSSLDEAELENNENKDEQDGKGFEDENGWDELFSDDDEDDFDVDIDIVSD
ncbi:hypothetical protein C0993_010323, partial [Termitomyces sp. T159_Od127]